MMAAGGAGSDTEAPIEQIIQIFKAYKSAFAPGRDLAKASLAAAVLSGLEGLKDKTPAPKIPEDFYDFIGTKFSANRDLKDKSGKSLKPGQLEKILVKMMTILIESYPRALPTINGSISEELLTAVEIRRATKAPKASGGAGAGVYTFGTASDPAHKLINQVLKILDDEYLNVSSGKNADKMLIATQLRSLLVSFTGRTAGFVTLEMVTNAMNNASKEVANLKLPKGTLEGVLSKMKELATPSRSSESEGSTP